MCSSSTAVVTKNLLPFAKKKKKDFRTVRRQSLTKCFANTKTCRYEYMLFDLFASQHSRMMQLEWQVTELGIFAN